MCKNGVWKARERREELKAVERMSQCRLLEKKRNFCTENQQDTRTVVGQSRGSPGIEETIAQRRRTRTKKWINQWMTQGSGRDRIELGKFKFSSSWEENKYMENVVIMTSVVNQIIGLNYW
uniref:Uncharacterized protein n=1 Tax=Rhodnius prolixus TaxID=13249 RepID=T1HZN0_RHOPR